LRGPGAGRLLLREKLLDGGEHDSAGFYLEFGSEVGSAFCLKPEAVAGDLASRECPEQLIVQVVSVGEETMVGFP